MKYNFDELINRYNTNSVKYDLKYELKKPENVIPMWVADMDFKVPEELENALVTTARHGVFGYTATKADYVESVQTWYKNNFSWDTKDEWVVITPSVLFAVSMAVRSLSEPGDNVLIQEPVYHPFRGIIKRNNRNLVVNQLVLKGHRYEIDFDDFEDKIKNNDIRLFILCSPHNPVGRVWTLDELTRMGHICKKYNVLVISDEIHSDLVYSQYKHTVFADIEDMKDIAVVCTAPTKTFNIAGLQSANAFIPNEQIRRRFVSESEKIAGIHLNVMGMVATKAAYDHGREWLDELLVYLEDNLNFLSDYIADNISEVKLIRPEGTYLPWLDFRMLNLDDKQLDDFLLHKAGLWLNIGGIFGSGGEGFARMNIACPKSVLQQALSQLQTAVKELNL